jgi:hypothetical protein
MIVFLFDFEQIVYFFGEFHEHFVFLFLFINLTHFIIY